MLLIKLKQIWFLVSFVFIVPFVQAGDENAYFFTKTPIPIQSFLQKSTPLTGDELKTLVVNNTMVGHTTHSHSIYELFFEKNGVLLFRKARDDKQMYVGKWWIVGDHIFSQWKSYKNNPRIIELQYYHLMGNIYVPRNINEACDHAGTYCLPFMVFKGDPFNLHLKATSKETLTRE